MALHGFGKAEFQVQFLVRAPNKRNSMAQIYRYKRTHVYYYEVVANDAKSANGLIRKSWAGSYKDMELSDYVLVKTTRFDPKPVLAVTPTEPEEKVEVKPVVKKAVKKAAKKAVKKTAAKKAVKKAGTKKQK